MRTANLIITTKTTKIEIEKFHKKTIVFFQNNVHFINIKKLDKILSLMKILSEFNDYINKSKNMNITFWLGKKKLLNKEILEEISFYKLPLKTNNSFFEVFSCFNGIEDIENLLIKSFKNFYLLNYFKSHNDEFNRYLSRVICFFEKRKKMLFKKEDPLDFLIKSGLEMNKNNILSPIQNVSKIKVKLIYPQNRKDLFEIRQIELNKQKIYIECLKLDANLEFQITFEEKNETIFPLLKLKEFISYQDVFYQNINEENKNKIKEFLNENNLQDMNIDFYKNLGLKT